MDNPEGVVPPPSEVNAQVPQPVNYEAPQATVVPPEPTREAVIESSNSVPPAVANPAEPQVTHPDSAHVQYTLDFFEGRQL